MSGQWWACVCVGVVAAKIIRLQLVSFLAC